MVGNLWIEKKTSPTRKESVVGFQICIYIIAAIKIMLGIIVAIEDVYSFIDKLAVKEYVKSSYLAERGIIPKAKLSAYSSVVSPNRTFDAGNKILESIPWEQYINFNKTLQLLSEI